MITGFDFVYCGAAVLLVGLLTVFIVALAFDLFGEDAETEAVEEESAMVVAINDYLKRRAS